MSNVKKKGRKRLIGIISTLLRVVAATVAVAVLLLRGVEHMPTDSRKKPSSASAATVPQSVPVRLHLCTLKSQENKDHE